MSAAGFVLAINVFVAGLFTAAFAVVAWRTPTVIGARWLSLGYGMGIINAVLEFALPAQADPRWMSLAVFTVPLLGFVACIVGLARHYGGAPPWRVLAGLLAVSVLANIAIESQSSSSFVHAAIYQAPYFLAHMLAAAVLLRSRRLDALDVTLVVFLLFSSLQYVAKPLLVAGLGAVSAQDYLQSAYGAYSQVLIAFLLITNGVLMLLIFVRDALAELTRRSQTDALSGLLNRGGFDDLADRMLASALRDGVPATMVVADLDYFKAINDNYGHEAGDRVIAAFGQVLGAIAEPRAIVGRLGGEEFAVFIPGTNLATARLYAEGVRSGFSGLSIAQLDPDRRVSASFGIAQLKAGDGLSDLLRRADAALYEAKKRGRDCVWVDEAGSAAPPAADPVLARRRGARRSQRA